MPVDRTWLSTAEIDRVTAMRFTKRRSEWLLARWTGKRALASVLGLPADAAGLARIEIRSVIGGSARGAPEVFVDGRRALASVSLTDRADWAVCTVAEFEQIGCDLELVEPRSDTFVQDYFTPTERSIVADPPFDASNDVLANLIWSAKESALKVLRTGLRRDTRSVEVDLSRTVPLDGWRPLVVHAEEGAHLPGWWRQYGEFLLTVVATLDFAPPRPLLVPPGLATAQPSHSWMAAMVIDEPPPGRRAHD